ncbi:hypothetical protein GQ473_03445, partial [archaeon]|nr:hypothetical protein [archaeon]
HASNLAEKKGETEYARKCAKKALTLSKALSGYKKGNNIVCSTHVSEVKTPQPKISGLDIATISAHVHYDGNHLNDPHLQQTVTDLVSGFKALYPINMNTDKIGLGRYLEDRYDGIKNNHQSDGGNPWNISNLIMAQFYYLKNQLGEGDKYLEWVLDHIPVTGKLSEQVNKYTGEPCGVDNLYWSHGEFIETIHKRNKLILT